METVPATVSKHSVDPKCIPKYFIPNAAYHGVTSQPSKSSGRLIGLGWSFGQKNKTTMNGPDIEEVDE